MIADYLTIFFIIAVVFFACNILAWVECCTWSCKSLCITCFIISLTLAIWGATSVKQSPKIKNKVRHPVFIIDDVAIVSFKNSDDETVLINVNAALNRNFVEGDYVIVNFVAEGPYLGLYRQSKAIITQNDVLPWHEKYIENKYTFEESRNHVEEGPM